MRDWEDGCAGGVAKRKEGWKMEIHGQLFICIECHSSPDPALIGQCRLTAGTRCRDLECSPSQESLCGS